MAGNCIRPAFRAEGDDLTRVRSCGLVQSAYDDSSLVGQCGVRMGKAMGKFGSASLPAYRKSTHQDITGSSLHPSLDPWSRSDSLRTWAWVQIGDRILDVEGHQRC